MTQTASLPTWAKALLITLTVIFGLILWQYAASYAMAFLLFKGHPPFPVRPWTLATYMVSYHDNKLVLRPAVLGLIVSGALIFGFPAWLLWPKSRSLHGDARLAKTAEIFAGGFSKSNGIIVGKRGNDFVCVPPEAHVNVQAPTGGGKGVAIVIPNLLSWNDSAIVLDVKRENYQLTGGFRKKHGHKVFLFDPLSPKRQTHRWNCFSNVPKELAGRIEEIQKIAHIWFPDQEGQDPIWAGGARGLFLGLALYILETGQHLCLGTLSGEACNGDVQRFKDAIANRKAAGNPFSRPCELALMDYFSAPDKTRDSIRKTFTSRLELFQNPYIDAATRESDFDIRQLRKERITIFLGSKPTDLARLAPLYNLFFEQVLAEHTGEEPADNPELKYQLLLLMDEFAALGKMMQLVRAVSFVRSYGIVLMPIYQSKSQVVGIYGQHFADTFSDNLKVHVVYRPDNVKDSEELSKWMGNTTVRSKSQSRPTMGGKGGSNSQSDAARALFLPQELRELEDDTVLIFAQGLGVRPFKLTKAYYYKKGALIERLKSVSPSLSALGEKIPSQDQLKAARFNGELSPPVPAIELPDYEPLPAAKDDRPVRPIEAGDMERLDSMQLSEFNLDFSNVEVPTGDMDESEMADFAEKVYQQILAN